MVRMHPLGLVGFCSSVQMGCPLTSHLLIPYNPFKNRNPVALPTNVEFEPAIVALTLILILMH